MLAGIRKPNLAEKHRKDILACTSETPLEQIKEVSQLCFKVQSISSEKIYKVNLLTYTCTCSNFPCIQLCKHIATVVHFLRGKLKGGIRPQAPDSTSASEWEPDLPKSPAQQDSSTGNAKSCSFIISVITYIVHFGMGILGNGAGGSRYG